MSYSAVMHVGFPFDRWQRSGTTCESEGRGRRIAQDAKAGAVAVLSDNTSIWFDNLDFCERQWKSE
jgi:hypothetical protein